jgi:hypothetical protein
MNEISNENNLTHGFVYAPMPAVANLDSSKLNNTIQFSIKGKIHLTLTENGFVYDGKTIEDAGEAHRLFCDFMRIANAFNDLDKK